MLLKILGQAKDKEPTQIEARLGSDTGPVCATINVNVYKEISLNGKYVRVFKTGDEANTIPAVIPKADIVKVANDFLQFLVVRLATLSDPTKLGIAFDKNSNGRVDLYNNGDNPELNQIYGDLQAAGIVLGDLVHFKDQFNSAWHISKDVKVHDTTIEMNDGIGRILANGTYRYRISEADGGKAESFTVTNIVNNVLFVVPTTGSAGFTKAHHLTGNEKTTHYVFDDQATIAGLDANTAQNATRPSLVTGDTAKKVGTIFAHEQGHGRNLRDINVSSNETNGSVPLN